MELVFQLSLRSIHVFVTWIEDYSYRIAKRIGVVCVESINAKHSLVVISLRVRLKVHCSSIKNNDVQK